MTATYNVVVTGELLPGHAREAVMQALAAVMRLPPERTSRLLEGQPVVVRRGVPESRVADYLAALRQAGADARAEPEPQQPAVVAAADPEGAPRPEPVAASPAAISDDRLALVPRGDEPAQAAQEPQGCPACDAPQPPTRTLCTACGVDMPRMRGAQLEAQREAARAAAPVRAASGAVRASPGEHCETPHPLGLSLDGRIGRLRYLAYALPAYLPLVAGLALGALIGGLQRPGMALVVLGGIGALVTVWLAIRAMVLRLHDLGRSGAWVLALVAAGGVAGFIGSLGAAGAVTVLTLAVSVLLILWPGSRGSNAYGAPPGPNTPWTIAGAVVVLVLSVVAGGSDPGQAWPVAGPQGADDPLETPARW